MPAAASKKSTALALICGVFTFSNFSRDQSNIVFNGAVRSKMPEKLAVLSEGANAAAFQITHVIDANCQTVSAGLR